MTFSKIIGTGLFTGYSPIAPGTAGSLLALLIFIFIPELSSVYWIGIIIVLFFVGVYCSTQLEKEYEHDPSQANIDEIVGMFIALVWLPKTWVIIFAGFFLFRIFDIVKPYPANKLESLPKGWGVMADDVLAGIYANIVLQIGVLLYYRYF